MGWRDGVQGMSVVTERETKRRSLMRSKLATHHGGVLLVVSL